jgi:tetratricopeptide (TPR) repeat protein
LTKPVIQADLPALSLRTLGSINLVLGHRAESETVLRRALVELRRASGEGHPDKGDMLNRLAFILLSRGATDADTLYAQAVAFDRAKPSAGPHFVTDGYEYLGWAARHKGNLALAEMLYRRALTLYEKELPVGHPYRAQTAVGLGQTLLDAGRSTEAEQYLADGLAHWRASRPPATERIAEATALLRRVRAGR